MGPVVTIAPIFLWGGEKKKRGCVKLKNAYHFVIQTTVGRKNLDAIKEVSEILRFALDDKMVWHGYYDIASSSSIMTTFRHARRSDLIMPEPL